ncbi:G2/mitotic-specific cyclin cdc13 [Psilocybe cubensis]|uniref:G2/mitotic-specific cyclin cdc13 n=2 Tax=Psilocybe cubensis TaxID=181762 RepID=A0ACB8GPY3_PSICU|nr:G2/mitotic-specific cyclin cdc13 [Psilocybe cubensis]KAH9477616.1 G2/mitotic-specific cyclin cdc13 [Psilocybe cubensis]
MSSIPVRRTTRVVRATKDTENANARPTRVAARLKTGVSTAASATTRATASTAASKAKSVLADAGKEEGGVKRKREALVEVTGLVTNNKPKDSAVSGAKGKEAEKSKELAAKTKGVVKAPVRRLVAGVATRRTVKAAVESTAAVTTSSKTSTQPAVTRKASVDHGEKMVVDQPRKVTRTAGIVKEEDEEATRVSKRRHTDEITIAKPVLDDSQAEADKIAAELEAADASNAPQLWDDLDAEDWDDPVMVSEYIAETCVYLKEIELACMPDPNYMEKQGEMTWEHRGILIDWLLMIHARFNLVSESLFLCVNILDRFLSQRPISISKLQLVGIACFFVATKFEETYAPSVKELAYLADNQYTIEEILKAERYLLKILDYDLRAPGPMTWLRRGSKADDCEVRARTIAKYLLEIGLVERRLIGIVPSLMSAASLWLARVSLGREQWTPNLEHYTTYGEKDILPIASILLEYIITNPIQHDSLFKKYAHKRFFRASAYIQSWALELWPENGSVNLEKDVADIKEECQRASLRIEA